MQSTLVCNMFHTELSRREFDLPYYDCSSWEDSTRILRDRLARHHAYRHPLENDQIRTIVFDGPERPPGHLSKNFDIAELPHFGTRLIEHSIARHLRAKGLKIQQTNFGLVAMPLMPTFSQARIDVHCGIFLQARRPFEADATYFVISVKWEVTAVFSESLANEMVRKMSIGLPALYKPSGDTPTELKQFRGRYIGHVRDLLSATEAVIHCKDGYLRTISTDSLYIEASPSAIREYERRINLRDDTRSAWRKIQELNFILTKEGRRNRSVLRDRLNAIRRFLASTNRDELAIPLACFEVGILSVNLSPVRIDLD